MLNVIKSFGLNDNNNNNKNKNVIAAREVLFTNPLKIIEEFEPFTLYKIRTYGSSINDVT